MLTEKYRAIARVNILNRVSVIGTSKRPILILATFGTIMWYRAAEIRNYASVNI